MFARTRALGVAFAITLVAGLALAQQSTVGGQSANPRFQTIRVFGDPATGPGATFQASGGGSDSAVWISSAAQAALGLRQGSAAANNRVWDFTANAEQFVGRAVDDANSGVGPWVTVDRTGTTIDTTNMQGTSVQANGVAVATVVAGQFTMTLTGCTANPNVTAEYYIVSGSGVANTSVVTLMIPSVSCTSNATTATLTGLPAAIQPGAQGGTQTCAPIRNNTAPVFGNLQLQIGSPTLIDLGAACGTSGGFTAAGTKGTSGGGPIIITYPLT